MTSPLAVKAQTAAAMLDMPQAEFMRLVERDAAAVAAVRAAIAAVLNKKEDQ